jgi:hypothetical protein
MSGAEAGTPMLTRGTNIARQVEIPLHNNSLQPTPLGPVGLGHLPM